MGKNNKKGPKANVFKVAGAKSLKKSKAKVVNLGLKNADISPMATTKYYRSLGIRRPYIDYTKTQLEDCLAAVRAKQFTLQDAAKLYKIPSSTIKYKLANKSNKNPGRQPSFTLEEEALFVHHISTLSQCGFPFTNLDMTIVIRDYLNSKQRIVSPFRNNIPGKDWLKHFVARNESLYRHQVNHRAHLSEESISNFIKHVCKETENVDPANIYSYDEISFGEDPIKNTTVWRRDCKYPELLVNAQEAGFTVLFCGNAEGETIPPFIISKTASRCSSCAENGPLGASYCTTKYGWIDVITFENWFLSHLLPILSKIKGKKVLIGDRLSSHISLKVLASSERENIRFVCLPPNSSHVLQPLEHGFYQPLQQIWFELLLSWKICKINGNAATTMKADFPCLLRAALDLLPDVKENLKNGFRETGIYPLSIEEPVNRCNKIREAFVKKRRLERQYYPPRTDCLVFEGSLNCEMEALDSKNVLNFDNILTSTSFKDWQNEPGESEQTNDVCLVIVNRDDILLIQFQHSYSPKNLLNVMIGDHVIVTCNSTNRPGKVLGTGEEGAFVHCMKRRNFCWTWPSVTKTKFYDWEQIVCKIDAPKVIKEGYYSVPELV